MTEFIKKNASLDAIIGAGLIVALLLSIFMDMRDLAMSIASGLVGYIGHGKVQQYQ